MMDFFSDTTVCVKERRDRDRGKDRKEERERKGEEREKGKHGGGE